MIERIGNFRIVGEIGAGGMAVIYKAVQESLNRTVAIKALKTSVSLDSHIAVRFEREALSMATLQHENILHIYDFQQLGGALFIIMEFVEGIDLYDLLAKCRILPIDVAAIIAMQVARALDYAHYRGIIHRDIKPANIMIAKSGGVKLMDFGIARDPSFGDLTEQGTGLGTPSYMSPEQILGDRLDFRSDIFSLGVVLYQMVCGSKPFIGDEEKSVLHKIRHDKHPSPRRLNPQVPRELERILAQCMHKERADRYPSTQDLVIALESFIARHCHMNYQARIVQFLQEQGVLSQSEAEKYLHPAGADFAKTPHLPERSAGMRRLLLLPSALVLSIIATLLVLRWSPLGRSLTQRSHSAASASTGQPGYVRVVVDPWARVYVDGQYMDVTPFNKALPLPPGKHRIELKENPYYNPKMEELTVRSGETQVLKVALVRK